MTFSLEPLRLWPFLGLGAALTLVLSLVLVATKKYHGHFSLDEALNVQSFHVDPTPRIGGLAIYLSMLLSFWALSTLSAHVDQSTSSLIGLVLLAALPSFLFGFAEDITSRVGPNARLAATMASVLFAVWLMNTRITSLEIPLLDSALNIPFISVAFTVFAVSGVVNAINIIDGFHGLASGVSIIILAALGLIALQAQSPAIALLCGLATLSIVGFFLVNFPFGKLFLGDGGAYLLGFLIGWVCVQLSAHNSNVSPWACLLACAYPVSETVYSMYRRAKTKLSVNQPDRAHLHSLIKQVLILHWFPHWSANRRNAAVSPVLWLLTLAPAVFAILNYSNTTALIVAFLAFFSMYVLFYRLLANRYRAPA